MTDDNLPSGADERGELWAGNTDKSDTEDTENAQDTTDAKTAWDVDSIRESWDSNQVRLPDSLQRRFDAQHTQLETDFTLQDVDREYRKDRHYKPLVIALGLRELDVMDTEDTLNALDTLEQEGYLPK